MRSVVTWAFVAVAVASLGQAAGKVSPFEGFFALCHDTHDARKRSLEQQAALLSELGYDGAGHLWLGKVDERLKTLDAHGLKLFQVYIRVNIAPSRKPYDPNLPQIIKQLKGRGTMLAVLVQGGKPSDATQDVRAVAILRELADLAQPLGIRIALYPHTGDWLERTEDALRVARKVDRANVGVMFNLCHWLKTDGDETKLAPLLKAALPHLFAMTINGADAGLGRRGGWDRLIQPLDSGTFDVHNLLKTLQGLGYTGPVGLQCYGLGGDARAHLARSIAAWRKLAARLDVQRTGGQR